MKKLMCLIQKRFVRSYSNDIDYDTLLRMLKQYKNIWLIDVRPKDEYYSKHIDGAINIPLQDLTLRIGKIVKNKNDIIIVYCEYGGRSIKACNKLERLGYLNIYNLKGGISGI